MGKRSNLIKQVTEDDLEMSNEHVKDLFGEEKPLSMLKVEDLQYEVDDSSRGDGVK